MLAVHVLPMSQSSPLNPIDEREQIRTGGAVVLADHFEQHRHSLERIVHFRLSPILRSRVEPADVIQEAYLTVSRRINEYLDGQCNSFFVWIRQITIQTLFDIQRHQFRSKRDLLREVVLPNDSNMQTSSLSIAHFLLDDVTSPSQAAVKAEEVEQLKNALDSMNETDREVLALRHFEQLSNQQVAEVLGLSPTAASNRYIRAAAKLSEIMNGMPNWKRGAW